MNIEEIRAHCIAKEEVEEGFPFGEEVLVFKVKGKMFLLTNIAKQPLQINVKCDPERAEELRDQYDCIIPGYHMNKKNWNTIIIDNTLSKRQLKEFIDHSYNLVAAVKVKNKKQK